MKENYTMKNDTTVCVSAVEANRHLKNQRDLIENYFTLVSLIKTESELKKHHRAYLHIREKIDALIKKQHPRVLDIAADTLKALSGGSREDLIEQDDCSECVCNCCICDECLDSPCYETDEFFPFSEAEEDRIPVVFPKEDYDSMVEDLLTMAELVSLVTEMRLCDMKAIHEFGKLVPAFVNFEKERISVYKAAAAEADEVLSRWEDIDFISVGYNN
jgi:hypothetical protein